MSVVLFVSGMERSVFPETLYLIQTINAIKLNVKIIYEKNYLLAFSILAHESRKVTIRLKTNFSAELSILSTQK